jgi:hypothetical protein
LSSAKAQVRAIASAPDSPAESVNMNQSASKLLGPEGNMSLRTTGGLQRSFHNPSRQLSTIDLIKDFVPPDGFSGASSRHTARLYSQQAVANSFKFVQPPTSVASSIATLPEISFSSPEAAMAASKARLEYIKHASVLPPLTHRPFSVPESSPR